MENFARHAICRSILMTGLAFSNDRRNVVTCQSHFWIFASFTSKLHMRQLHYGTRGWAGDLIAAEFTIYTNLTGLGKMNSNRLCICGNRIPANGEWNIECVKMIYSCVLLYWHKGIMLNANWNLLRLYLPNKWVWTI